MKLITSFIIAVILVFVMSLGFASPNPLTMGITKQVSNCTYQITERLIKTSHIKRWAKVKAAKWRLHVYDDKSMLTNGHAVSYGFQDEDGVYYFNNISGSEKTYFQYELIYFKVVDNYLIGITTIVKDKDKERTAAQYAIEGKILYCK